jgi:hypothetical protein
MEKVKKCYKEQVNFRRREVNNEVGQKGVVENKQISLVPMPHTKLDL